MVCVREIIMSGGNFATLSFVGCIQGLMDTEEFDIASVNRWVGTSGGAVIAFLFAIGYTPSTILHVTKNIPLSHISPLTSDKWLQFFDKYGLHDTKCFRSLFETLLVHMCWSRDVTFLEFYEKSGIELVFTTYCLNTDTLELLNYTNTPDLKLLDGLCMAIAVPFLFFPVSL